MLPQSCPATLNSEAQIVFYNDRVLSPEIRQPIVVDTNLTFFREILGFDDAEIQQETQNAFQFFNERFGLDFSLLEPNELGVHFFQNATFQPFRVACGPTANFNRWLLTGNTQSPNRKNTEVNLGRSSNHLKAHNPSVSLPTVLPRLFFILTEQPP